MTGKIKGIYIAKTGQPPLSKSSAQVKANKGIVGDRYYDGHRNSGRQLYLCLLLPERMIWIEEVAPFWRCIFL